MSKAKQKTVWGALVEVGKLGWAVSGRGKVSLVLANDGLDVYVTVRALDRHGEHVGRFRVCLAIAAPGLPRGRWDVCADTLRGTAKAVGKSVAHVVGDVGGSVRVAWDVGGCEMTRDVGTPAEVEGIWEVPPLPTLGEGLVSVPVSGFSRLLDYRGDSSPSGSDVDGILPAVMPDGAPCLMGTDGIRAHVVPCEVPVPAVMRVSGALARSRWWASLSGCEVGTEGCFLEGDGWEWVGPVTVRPRGPLSLRGIVDGQGAALSGILKVEDPAPLVGLCQAVERLGHKSNPITLKLIPGAPVSASWDGGAVERVYGVRWDGGEIVDVTVNARILRECLPDVQASGIEVRGDGAPMITRGAGGVVSVWMPCRR